MKSLMNMKKAFVWWLVGATLVAGVAIAGCSQNVMPISNGNSGPASADQHAAKAIWLAGCLERGPGADQVGLRDRTLQWWGLKSDTSTLPLFSIRRSGWLS